MSELVLFRLELGWEKKAGQIQSHRKMVEMRLLEIPSLIPKLAWVLGQDYCCVFGGQKAGGGIPQWTHKRGN